MPDAGPPPVFHDTGTGPALVFLHAFPLDASQWDHQVAALSGDFRCLRPDMWGCGESELAGDPMSVSLDDYAGALLAGLDRLGVEKTIVVGSSMGGYTAFALLRRAPQRVRGLVLSSSRSAADSASQAADRISMAERALSEGTEFIVDPMVQRLLGPRARGEAHIVDPVCGRIRRCRPQGIAACQHAMAKRPDSSGGLATIAIPTLVVAGDQDSIMSVAEAEAQALAVPGAQTRILAGAGHLANLEDPHLFNVMLWDFLEDRFLG